jgi:3-hydroxyisobutyrate dehydrogenase-like beta-hydroxyacid dehydrogenase
LANVGFLGLGTMGAPMTLRLIDAGHQVTVWSHNQEKAERFAAAHGCRAAKTPADVARQSETVFLCVGDSAMSHAVVLGRDGLIETAAPGSVVIDSSTIAPKVSREIAARLSEKQVGFLDAPCTGSKAGAESGTLSFMIGGDPAVFARVRPLLEAMGRQLFYCGVQGKGLHAKLSQNLILGNMVQAFNEGMVLSAKGGVAPELMLDIINNTGVRSGYVAGKGDGVLRGDFAPTFSVRWLEKDLGLALDLGAALETPLPVTAAAQQQLRTAIAMGYGEEDISGSIRALEDVAACKVRRSSLVEE